MDTAHYQIFQAPNMAMNIEPLEFSQTRFITFTVTFKCKYCRFECRVLNEMERHSIVNHCRIYPFSCSVCGENHKTIETVRLHVKSHTQQLKTPKIIEQDWSRWSQFTYVISSYRVQLGVEYRSNAQFMCTFCNAYVSADFNEMLIHLAQTHPSWVTPSHCDLCTYHRLKKIRDINELRLFGSMNIPPHNLASCLVTCFKVTILPDVPPFPMWKSTTTLWDNLLSMTSQCSQFSVSNPVQLPLHSACPIPTSAGLPTIQLSSSEGVSLVPGPNHDIPVMPQQGNPSPYPTKQLSQLTVSSPNPSGAGKEPLSPTAEEADHAANASTSGTPETEKSCQKYVDLQSEIFYEETFVPGEEVDSVGNTVGEDSDACALDLSNHPKDDRQEEAQGAAIDLSISSNKKGESGSSKKTLAVPSVLQQKLAVNSLKTNLLKYLVRLRHANAFMNSSLQEQEQYISAAIHEFLNFHRVKVFDRKQNSETTFGDGTRKRKTYDGDVIDLTKEDSVSISSNPKDNGLMMSKEGFNHLVKLAIRHLQRYFDGYQKGLAVGGK